MDSSFDTALQDSKPVYAFRDIRLKVGDRAQLDPPTQIGVGRVPVKVVGWVENHSLIVTAPRSAGGRVRLRTGEVVMLRAFTGRSAFAFRCSVLKNCEPPYEYLHLSYPTHVHGVDVRSSPRYRLDTPARVTLAGGEAVEAQIDDIGTTGALLVAGQPLGNVGDSMKVAFDVELHAIPVSLALEATIRSVRSDEAVPDAPRHRHGVSFVSPSPNDSLILAALVWFHMHENPALAA